MTVIIRPITKEDDQRVGEIVQESLKEAGLDMKGTAYYDPYLFRLSEIYQPANAKYWVLEKAGRVIGGGGIGPFNHSAKTGELQKLYIEASEQGNGYAHLLMEKGIQFAEQHYEELYIETVASLDKANYLYKRYGFESLQQPLEGTEHSACDTWLLKKLHK